MTSHDPILFHRIQGQKSILCLLVSKSRIYAGSQGGDLIVSSLDSFEHVTTVHAHRGSLLALYSAADEKILFSSGGDAIVNVWDTETFSRTHSIYSTYDVGDVFCVAFNSDLQTIYLGAQNTSIQWLKISEKDERPKPDPTSHPSYRNHRFFDSKGPTGIPTPRPVTFPELHASEGQVLEIDKHHVVQYAHFGYVYCMLLTDSLSEDDEHSQMLISGGGDGTIKLWAIDDDDGSLGRPTVLENGDLSVLTIALDDTLLFSGRLEGEVNIWDLDTQQLIRTIKVHPSDVLTIAIGHDMIFSASACGAVKVLNAQYQSTSIIKAHEKLILASTVTSHNDRQLYITGGNDGCIAVWDISNCSDKPTRHALTSNEELVTSLEKFVSYPTISSKPDYAQDCRRGASFLRSLFKRFGAETDLLSHSRQMNPIVFARFSGSCSDGGDKKTILFYGHYDVVGANSQGQSWKTDPFELQGINGYLYGRGVSDNKGPVLAALYAVADIVARKRLGCDVVFIIEGEEESGSRGFEDTVKKYTSLIGKVDWILLANSYWLTDEIPCLTYGLRGVIRATVEIASSLPDLHSGVDGSRLIFEPLKDLIALLATLTGPNGAIMIPGFYDWIPPISDSETKRFDRISQTLLRENPSLADLESLVDSFKARWREPSLTIHHIYNSGVPNLSIISRVARADLSIRLVPNQTTTTIRAALQQALESAFERTGSSNTLTVRIEHQAEPWLGDPNNKMFKTLEEAIMEVWDPRRSTARPQIVSSKRASQDATAGLKSPKLIPAISTTLSSTSMDCNPAPATEIGPSTSASSSSSSRKSSSSHQRIPQRPLYIREGGSIPAIRFLEQEFNAPAAHLPCGQASDSAHLDNERLRLVNLYKSREIFRRVFLELPLR